MNSERHLQEAKRLYQKALEEFEKAKERGDDAALRDACGKGWLSTIEATYALLIKKGVKEEELPQLDRGRRYMVHKYAERELKWLYFSLRDNLHIESYYNGSLNFDEVQTHLDDLSLYIQRIEGS